MNNFIYILTHHDHDGYEHIEGVYDSLLKAESSTPYKVNFVYQSDSDQWKEDEIGGSWYIKKWEVK